MLHLSLNIFHLLSLQLHTERKSFVEIRSSLHLLERLAASVKGNEPVLLVGETGTGKTTLVQDLALRLGQRLTVLVMLFRFCHCFSPSIFQSIFPCVFSLSHFVVGHSTCTFQKSFLGWIFLNVSLFVIELKSTK